MSGIYRGVNGSATADALNIDGNKGDLTISNSGLDWTINPDKITFAKMQNISTDTVLGRATAGSGDVEEIPCTAAGRALLDDANAAAQRTTLGVVPGTDVLAYDANLQSFVNTFTLPTVDGTAGFILTTDGAGTLALLAPTGVTDGDKGDITVSGTGTVWEIDAGVVSTTELGGDITAAGKALLDDADASAQRTTLGLGALATQGDGDKGDITVSASGATWTIDDDTVTNAKLAFDGGSFGFRNKLIGGSATTNPWQQGTSFTSATTPANSDDTYTADQWYLLTDGNDIVDFTQSTDAPTGSLYSFQFDVETANKKFGFAQIIEQKNCQALIGGLASLSLRAKVTGSSLTNIKAAVVSWSGTADVVTSDIVSAWNADGVTPTLIANATFENTPADLNVTTSWAEYKIENIAIDTASTKNLIVFIWCDNATTTIGDLLNIENVQLEQGSVSTAFENRDVGTELRLCQRYARPVLAGAVGRATGSSQVELLTVLSPEMRVAPTLSFGGFPNAQTAVGQLSIGDTGAISIASSNCKKNSIYVLLNTTANTAGAFCAIILGDILFADARL